MRDREESRELAKATSRFARPSVRSRTMTNKLPSFTTLVVYIYIEREGGMFLDIYVYCHLKERIRWVVRGDEDQNNDIVLLSICKLYIYMLVYTL